MGQPSIGSMTRTGILNKWNYNIFLNNYKNNYLNNYNLFIFIVKILFNYGFLVYKNFYYNNIFYKKFIVKGLKFNYKKYYRNIYINNKELGIKTFFKARNDVKDLIYSNFFIFKLFKWIIIKLYYYNFNFKKDNINLKINNINLSYFYNFLKLHEIVTSNIFLFYLKKNFILKKFYIF